MLPKAEQVIHLDVVHQRIQCVLLMTHVLVKGLDAADGKYAKSVKNTYKSRNIHTFVSAFFMRKIESYLRR